MHIEVSFASKEPKNISITIFDANKYHGQNFSLFGPKNITFSNILTQKYRTYLPVCACAECPPWDSYLVRRLGTSHKITPTITQIHLSFHLP